MQTAMKRAENTNTQGSQHIGDISKRLDISARTIRYYEELGLIATKRSGGGYREYSNFEVEKLETIIKLKNLGLSLDEIQNLIKLKNSENILRALEQKKKEFQQKIAEYKDGIKEIDRLVAVIGSCPSCREDAEITKCESCLKTQNKEMPKLMKAIF